MGGHQNGVSVFGSGVSVGYKNGETNIINRSGEYIQGGSTVIDTSGIVRLTHVDNTANIKIAGGTVGFSGWINTNLSTGLTAIKHLDAGIKRLSTGAWAYTSGQATSIDFAFSGGVFDLFPRVQSQNLSSVTTSAGTSNVISWTAIGT